MADQQTGASISEAVANWSSELKFSDMPETVNSIVTKVVLDGAGLMVAARHEDYVKAIVASADGDGRCTALGHDGGFSAADAASFAYSIQKYFCRYKTFMRQHHTYV